MFNKEWFEKLPPDIQKILLEEGRALQDKGRAAVRTLNKKLVDVLKSAKVETYQLSAAEREGFEKATLPGRDAFRKSMGKRAAKLLDDVEAYLKTIRK